MLDQCSHRKDLPTSVGGAAWAGISAADGGIWSR
jgi:hypothetical protein